MEEQPFCCCRYLPALRHLPKGVAIIFFITLISHYLAGVCFHSHLLDSHAVSPPYKMLFHPLKPVKRQQKDSSDLALNQFCNVS